jgi:mannitol-specific phosphotransferase system IIBC component
VLSGLDAGDVTKIGVGVIIALVVIGILVGLLITAIIGRIIIAVIVIALAVFVWQQRSSVENKINHDKNHVCNSFNATFFGIHLDAPSSVKKKCRHLG